MRRNDSATTTKTKTPMKEKTKTKPLDFSDLLIEVGFSSAICPDVLN
jgi:hypothetical protein